MFKRKGSPVKIDVVEYDENNETDFSCPICNHKIGKQSNGITKVASKKVIGRVSAKCPKCGKEIDNE